MAMAGLMRTRWCVFSSANCINISHNLRRDDPLSTLELDAGVWTAMLLPGSALQLLLNVASLSPLLFFSLGVCQPQNVFARIKNSYVGVTEPRVSCLVCICIL